MGLTELFMEYQAIIIIGFLVLASVIYNAFFANKKKEIQKTEEPEDEDDEPETWQCNVCEEWKDKEEVIEFDTTDAEIGICKSCIDEAYPREKEIVEKEVIKEVNVQEDSILSKDIMGDLE